MSPTKKAAKKVSAVRKTSTKAEPATAMLGLAPLPAAAKAESPRSGQQPTCQQLLR